MNRQCSFRSSPRQRTAKRFAALVVLVLLGFGSASAMAQEDEGCRQPLLQMADKNALGLRVVLERMSPAQQTKVMQWANCNDKTYGLVAVYETAIRTLSAGDKPESPPANVYISPSQTLKLISHEGGFARSELVARVGSVAQARTITSPLLSPPLGQKGWSDILVDLNAETHALQAQTALASKGLAEKPLEGKELASALLLTGAYIQHAKEKHPVFFNRLASSAETVDALGLLWRRAEQSLLKAKAQGLTADTAPIVKAAHGFAPAFKDLFGQAGLPAPEFQVALGDSAPQKPADTPVVKTDNKEQAGSPTPDNPAAQTHAKTPEVAKADTTPKAAPEDGGKKDTPKTDSADPKEAKADPKVEKKVEPKDKPKDKTKEDPKEDPKNAAKTPDAKNVQKTDVKKADAKEGTKEGTKEGDKDSKASDATAAGEDNTSLIVRLVLGALLLLAPWIWIGVLVLLKRRQKLEQYTRLANRSLAIGTLLLVFECLLVVLCFVFQILHWFASWNSLFLLFPLYFFAVMMLMFRRLDPNEELSSRRLMRKWAKWGGIVTGVVLVGNLVVLLIPGINYLSQFILPPSFAILALLGIIFLIKLWRTGNDNKDGATPEGGEEQSGEDTPNTPVTNTPVTDPPAMDAPSGDGLEELPQEVSAPLPPKPSAPEPPAATDAGDNSASEMSDEDLAKALEALEGGGGGGGSDEEVPDDRQELYKLLGGE